jgi:hypothetical protein
MHHPFIAGTRPHQDAAALIDAFGADAAGEAKARAAASRRVGNHIHFCRWREVERLIAALRAPAATGTLH